VVKSSLLSGGHPILFISAPTLWGFMNNRSLSALGHETIELTRKLLDIHRRLRQEMHERKLALSTTRAALRRTPLGIEALKRHWEETHDRAA